MKKLLLKYTKALTPGEIIDRPNRFTLRIRLNSSVQRVHLPNPGKLSTVVARGRKILCEPSENKKRKTRFSAFAIQVGDFYVTVNSMFANQIFSTAIEKGLLDGFHGYTIEGYERMSDIGRIDFVLNTPSGKRVYVEVKSCTHVEEGVAKFPDRPTERGKRHLRLLKELAEKGKECHLVFVIQRPDARKFRPFTEVDPEFARMLREAREAGVGIRAIVTEFRPPNLHLIQDDLPVELDS